jgi:hypothetical protein
VRRLRDFQIVGLRVPGTAVTCRVVAVDGGQAVLEPRSAAELDALALPAAATLSFETERHPVLLSGAVDAGPIPGTAAFWITDDVGVRPVRLRPRLKAELAVRVTPVDTDGRRRAFARDYATTDVSAGGVAIAGLDGAAGDALLLELAVPGLSEVIRCGARVVRRAPDGTTAVAFSGLDPQVARTLDRLIFAVRQRVAREAFALRDAA